MQELDSAVRAAAFAWLDEQRRRHGEALPYSVLREGFEFEGHRVPIVGPQGIFKPAILRDAPLSITTAAPKPGQSAPYEDELTEDGLLLYRFRGTDPSHPDNAGLRRAQERRLPLIYLYGVETGFYEPEYPVYVVGERTDDLAFVVDLTSTARSDVVGEPSPPYGEVARSYATRTVLQRLHQRRFKRQVIAAYSHRCAVCQLRRTELLDAAHILPDADPRSEPIVPNGLALCTLHHPAFDRYVIGIRPDLKIEVRTDVLEDEDGPILVHGLQGFQGSSIIDPRPTALRPNREFLEERYELFRQAG